MCPARKAKVVAIPGIVVTPFLVQSIVLLLYISVIFVYSAVSVNLVAEKQSLYKDRTLVTKT